MDSNCSWLIEALRDHHRAVQAIQSGDLNQIEAVVRPVDVSWKQTQEGAPEL